MERRAWASICCWVYSSEIRNTMSAIVLRRCLNVSLRSSGNGEFPSSFFHDIRIGSQRLPFALPHHAVPALREQRPSFRRGGRACQTPPQQAGRLRPEFVVADGAHAAVSCLAANELDV